MNGKTACIAIAMVALATACESKKDHTASSGTAKTTGAAPTLKPQATPIKAGQPFTVDWTGPAGANDYIDVVAPGRPQQVGDEVAYVKTAAGNPAKLTVAEPGAYDVRYVQDTGERKVIAHTAITVVK